MTAEPRTHRSKAEDVKHATERLRLIEKISKFREDKIKKEFAKLEEELKMDEEKQREAALKEQRMQEYYQK